MKRAIVIGTVVVATALAGAGALYGPELVAGYRFMNTLDEHNARYLANGGAWPQLQDTCALCHGARGQPANTRYASLAGQSAAYIEAQLQAFAQGRRHSAQMSPLAANLTQEQIKFLADYFSRQTAGQTEAPASDQALEQRAKAKVATTGCVACHGENLSGGPLAPRIAGQGQLYLTDQLTAFKQGQRKDPTQAMNALASTLSEDDIKAVAHYLGTLAPAPGAK
ncbi:Cytochrome c4 [Pseudomonas chlororaphis subsp. aurantiaca]|nr:Cytochrome c4 [Pseudomonas chlororaphis subsp. aurantiaca]